MARPATHKAEDWIAAGWRALVRGGPAAVRIEALARDLGVTKGSFYGYFTDRAALLAAMLAQWRERAGGALIARVEAQRGTAQVEYWVLPACSVAPGWELGAGGATVRARRDSRNGYESLLQLKTVFQPLPPDGWAARLGICASPRTLTSSANWLP